jgi:hypothetical protein
MTEDITKRLLEIAEDRSPEYEWIRDDLLEAVGEIENLRMKVRRFANADRESCSGNAKPLWKRPNDLRAVIAAFMVIVAALAVMWYFGTPTYLP